MAEMERELISERTKMGMNQLKATHRKFTQSIYGWDTNEQGSVEPNWLEQGMIDYMRWMLNLGGAGIHSEPVHMNLPSGLMMWRPNQTRKEMVSQASHSNFGPFQMNKFIAYLQLP
mgnify:CR=1 FL=1|jgi:hypothetical protein